jgi:hypothetical protein
MNGSKLQWIFYCKTRSARKNNSEAGALLDKIIFWRLALFVTAWQITIVAIFRSWRSDPKQR